MNRSLCFALVLMSSAAAFAQQRTKTVAADGSGDFKTVQEAIAAVPEKNSSPILIHVKPGTYAGPFIVPKSKPHITLLGDDTSTTILTWDRNMHDAKPPGANSFNPGLWVRADDFQAYHLTIENSSGDHGQAVALRVDGDREIFAHCRITGWQDTLMVNDGRDFFRDCYIAGRVDFIFGSATAWFEHCEIHSRNGGHVTAASTPRDRPFGFVFSDCTLTSDTIPWNPATTNPAYLDKPRITPLADLGRPWRPDANVMFLNCFMGAHIKPEGWNNWGKESNEKTARYCEYHSRGPGNASDKRVPWSHQLTDAEAQKITRESALGGGDHWDPSASVKAQE